MEVLSEAADAASEAGVLRAALAAALSGAAEEALGVNARTAAAAVHFRAGDPSAVEARARLAAPTQAVRSEGRARLGIAVL